jgi:hypothetical protein
MYAILFRADGTRTLYETDEYPLAVAVLETIVLDEYAELIDYSPNLDGSIDDLLSRLDSVKIGYPVAV